MDSAPAWGADLAMLDISRACSHLEVCRPAGKQTEIHTDKQHTRQGRTLLGVLRALLSDTAAGGRLGRHHRHAAHRQQAGGACATSKNRGGASAAGAAALQAADRMLQGRGVEGFRWCSMSGL